MTRRLRTDRMLRRVRETRTVELLRASGEEVRERAAIGWLPSGFLEAGPVGDEQVARWQRAWDETVGDGRPQRLIWLPTRLRVRPHHQRKSTPRGLPRMRVRAQRNNREHRDALIARTVQLYGQLQTVNQILEAHGLPSRPTDPNGATQP